MNAPELLEAIESRGAAIRCEPDATGALCLKIRPAKVVADLLPEIQRFKPALLELLEGQTREAQTPEAANIAKIQARSAAFWLGKGVSRPIDSSASEAKFRAALATERASNDFERKQRESLRRLRYAQHRGWLE